MKGEYDIYRSRRLSRTIVERRRDRKCASRGLRGFPLSSVRVDEEMSFEATSMSPKASTVLSLPAIDKFSDQPEHVAKSPKLIDGESSAESQQRTSSWSGHKAHLLHTLRSLFRPRRQACSNRDTPLPASLSICVAAVTGSDSELDKV